MGLQQGNNSLTPHEHLRGEIGKINWKLKSPNEHGIKKILAPNGAGREWKLITKAAGLFFFFFFASFPHHRPHRASERPSIQGDFGPWGHLPGLLAIHPWLDP